MILNNRVSSWFLLGSFAFLSTISRAANDLDFNVFGKDDRKEVTSTAYPWKAVGRLSTGCTGTLVGADLVVTAAHCVLEGKTGKLTPWLTSFTPNQMTDGKNESFTIKHVWWGTSDPDANRAHDWALIRLDKRAGDTYGWLGVEDSRPNWVTLVGYSGDFRGGMTAGTHQDCRLRDYKYGMYYHDCDATRGSSGGPIFYTNKNGNYIVAINVAEFRNGGETSLYPSQYSESVANIAIPARTFLSKLKELK